MNHKVWFYFRHGYAYYIASVLAPFNTIMILVGFSSKFGIPVEVLYIVIPLIVIIGAPIVILIGKKHYENAYKSEVDVMTRANQYNYTVLPGSKEATVLLPIQLEIIRYLRSKADNEKLKSLEEKLVTLLEDQ